MAIWSFTTSIDSMLEVMVRSPQLAKPATGPMGTPPDSLFADVVGVFTLTIASVGFAVSLAVLVLGGALEEGLPRVIGSFVVGSGVMAIVVARRSHIVPVATFVQDGPALAMAAVVADFVAREGAGVTDVVVLLSVAMLISAACMGALGHLGLGGVGRSLPAPVVGAFVGGMGWLLFKGGFDVMTNSSLSGSNWRGLFDWEIVKLWGPGLVVGVLAWLGCRSRRLADYAPALIICIGLGCFYTVVGLTSSVSAVEAAGWLLGPFPETAGVQLVTPTEFGSANWWGIARMAPGIAGVVAVTSIAQLFSLTGIRAEIEPELDLDHELRIGARANLAAAVVGATPGFQGLGYTVLLHQLGVRSRAVAVVSGGLAVGFGVMGIGAIGYVPRFIIGAMLVMVGLALLDSWMRRLARMAVGSERLLSAVIVGAIAFFGLLEGIAFGLAATGLMFIVDYSRVDPVRLARIGYPRDGVQDRTPREVERLSAIADGLVVVELQGFLFFGALPTIEDCLRMVTCGFQGVQMLVIDFSDVRGVDRSVRLMVARLLREFRDGGGAIWICGINATKRSTLLASEPGLAAEVVFVPTLDMALTDAGVRGLAQRIGTTPQLTSSGSKGHV